MKKLKLLAMSLAAIMTVSTVGMGDYAAVKGDDTTTCEVSTFSGNECVTYGKTVTSDMGVSSGSLSDIVDGNENNLWIAGGRITGTITIDLGAYLKPQETMESGDIQLKERMMKVIGICYGTIVTILITVNL